MVELKRLQAESVAELERLSGVVLLEPIRRGRERKEQG